MDNLKPTFWGGVHPLGVAAKTATKADRKVELVFRADTAHGPFQAILDQLVTGGVKVLAHCSFSDTYGTTLFLVAENDLIARHVLEAAGYHYQTESVVLVQVPRQPDSMVRLQHDLEEAGVAVIYSYVRLRDEGTLVAVFKTLDDERTLQVLGESGTDHGVYSSKVA